MWLDEYYLFHETLRDYRNKQSKDKQEELERVLRHETLPRASKSIERLTYCV